MSQCGALSTILIACLAGCGGSNAKSSGSTNGMDGGAKHHVVHSRDAAAGDHMDAGGTRDSGRGVVGAAMDAALDASALDAAAVMDAAEADAAADAFVPMCPAVTLSFEGEVATVAKTPLGLDNSVRTTAVTGSFEYLPCVPDQEPDPQRGIYDPDVGNFSLSVGGLQVAGSGQPRVEVENFSSDTMRWRDGNIPLNPLTRVMTVDGKPSPTLEVLIAITDGSGAALSSDRAPTAFPFLDIASYPHTFSVSDSGGTLLLQLSSLTQQ